MFSDFLFANKFLSQVEIIISQHQKDLAFFFYFFFWEGRSSQIWRLELFPLVEALCKAYHGQLLRNTYYGQHGTCLPDQNSWAHFSNCLTS